MPYFHLPQLNSSLLRRHRLFHNQIISDLKRIFLYFCMNFSLSILHFLISKFSRIFETAGYGWLTDCACVCVWLSELNSNIFYLFKHFILYFEKIEKRKYFPTKRKTHYIVREGWMVSGQDGMIICTEKLENIWRNIKYTKFSSFLLFIK